MKKASLQYRMQYHILRMLLPRGHFAYRGPKYGTDAVMRLREQGFTFLPPFDPQPFVRHFLQGVQLDAYFQAHDMRGYVRSNAVISTGDCLLSEFAICHKALACEYLGLPSTRIHYSVSVDALYREELGQVREKDGYDGATNFHRDVDAWRWLKVFVYLTDVEEGDGHHEIYPGSHRQFPPELRAIKRYEPEQLDVHWNRLKVIGPAGTCFAENTLAFHRGTTPVRNSRLALTAVYYDDSVLGIHPGMHKLG